MILVDDVVADAKVGERRERPTETRIGSRRPLAEDLRVGEEDEAKVAPDEAAARRRDREAHARFPRERGVVRVDRALDLPQQTALPQRLAAVRERDDDPVVRADEAGELVLGLGEAARRDRRPLRLELERLAARKRIELGGTLERDRLEALLLPDAPHVVGLPDEVGRAIDGCDEIGGTGCDAGPTLRRFPEVRRALDVDGLDPTLGRGIDARRRDGMQRALRERREGSDLLDLVAEELDAQRLASGRREDVDDAASHGELAALVDSSTRS